MIFRGPAVLKWFEQIQGLSFASVRPIIFFFPDGFPSFFLTFKNVNFIHVILFTHLEDMRIYSATYYGLQHKLAGQFN